MMTAAWTDFRVILELFSEDEFVTATAFLPQILGNVLLCLPIGCEAALCAPQKIFHVAPPVNAALYTHRYSMGNVEEFSHFLLKFDLWMLPGAYQIIARHFYSSEMQAALKLQLDPFINQGDAKQPAAHRCAAAKKQAC